MGWRVRRSWVNISAVLALLWTGCVEHQKPQSPVVSPQATAPAVWPAPVPEAPDATQLAKERQKRVQALIHQVDAAYSAGESNYRKGRLPEAKREFDRAVDMMLVSGFDIRTEPGLQEEFDRVLDGVNSLEMQALRRGNGFVAPEEPTPADVAQEVTFKVDPNFVAKARANLATTKSDLPLVMNDYVAAFINLFANTTRGHYTLLHSFQRAGRYKGMIERVMAEEGVPQDLIYLAVAESSFNPRAMNGHSHAGGMWQFMPHDKFYGLAQTPYVDERFDPEKSTRAYARYMKFIYNQLGDWYLSMAGYNWGTGRIQQAVQKTGYADFWELYKRNNLPAETKNYVPEILAAIIIANHPSQYGFDDITLDAPVVTDTVTVNSSIDLHLVADIVGAPMEEMTALNPSLLRSITPPDSSFDLHLPAGTAMLFEKAMALIPENKRTGWRYHRVKEGETLASVAHEFRVSTGDLASANKLEETATLKGVDALVIPSAPSVAASRGATAAAAAAQYTTYTTRKGDTLVTIADRYGVSLDQLRHWNKLKGTKVGAGKRLRVADAASTPRSSRSRHADAAESNTKESVAKDSGAKENSAQENSAKDSHTKQGRTKKGSVKSRESAAQESASPASVPAKGVEKGTRKKSSKARHADDTDVKPERSTSTKAASAAKKSAPAASDEKSSAAPAKRHKRSHKE